MERSPVPCPQLLELVDVACRYDCLTSDERLRDFAGMVTDGIGKVRAAGDGNCAFYAFYAEARFICDFCGQSARWYPIRSRAGFDMEFRVGGSKIDRDVVGRGVYRVILIIRIVRARRTTAFLLGNALVVNDRRVVIRRRGFVALRVKGRVDEVHFLLRKSREACLLRLACLV